MKTILKSAADLAAGKTSSTALTEAALERAQDQGGEGARVFTKLYADEARAAAAASDAARAAGHVASPLSGLPISIKDLFDVGGETTMAGSRACEGEPAAVTDAPVVGRLKAAGAVIIGKTNMTEFAYSGLGLNPHYGTPLNVWDRATGRIPGGSSSGAAISVTDDMAVAGIGTDTGGSARIPTALNGLTGFKPTARRVPTAGAFPLSTSQDSIGPLARSVACCAILDAVMAGAPVRVPDPAPLDGLRLAVPKAYVFDDVDDTVAASFEAALGTLSGAGASIARIPLRQLERIPGFHAKGGFPAPESYAIHRDLMERAGERYDPRVIVRIRRGTEQSAADYIELTRARAAFIDEIRQVTSSYDALVFPTVPQVAPPLEPLEADDDAYAIANLLMLRNPTVLNFLDGCALSLPCHEAGAAPVGLMVAGLAMSDARILAIGRAVEAALAG